MSRPSVWVIKEQVRRQDVGSVPIDYTPAMKYGDVQFITEFDLPTHPSSTVAKRWHEAVRNFLHKYDESADWIILTGAPLSIFMVGALIGAANVAPRILVWRREQGAYIPFETDMVNA